MEVRNILDNTAKSFLTLVKGDTWSELTDPTFYEFTPIFHMNAPSGLFASKDVKNSALAYLIRIGEVDRAVKLEKLIEIITNIQTRSPWVFKTCSGLSEAMQRPILEREIVDAQIQFEMFECIDWRTLGVIELYNSIVYDKFNGIEILPKNLQYFMMSVYIRDVRIIQNDESGTMEKYFGEVYQNDTTDSNGNVTKGEFRKTVSIQSNTHKLFHFAQCTFLPTSGTEQFETIDNTDFTTEVSSNWDIGYRFMMESSKFRTLTSNVDIISNPQNVNTMDGVDGQMSNIYGQNTTTTDRFPKAKREINELIDRAKSIVDWSEQKTKLNNIYDTTTDNIDAQIDNRVSSEIVKQTKLGNVYDFSPADLLELLETNNIMDLDGIKTTSIENSEIYDDAKKLDINIRHIDNLFIP